MSLSPTRAQYLASPKRKREDSSPHSSSNSSSTPRDAASLQTYPLPLARLACSDEPSASSQTSVTGKFENLAIRGNVAHNTSQAPPNQHVRKRLAAMAPASSQTDSSTLLREYQLASELYRRDIQPPSAFSFGLEPSPTFAPEPRRRQSRSPPLNGEPQANFWHDSEITGHNPTDPTDDGYGINGIGFKPTPAIAWARSQKRRQQLADYKSRETKEARQRRIERRRVPASEEGERGNQDGRSTKMRVRFDDG